MHKHKKIFVVISIVIIIFALLFLLIKKPEKSRYNAVISKTTPAIKRIADKANLLFLLPFIRKTPFSYTNDGLPQVAHHN